MLFYSCFSCVNTNQKHYLLQTYNSYYPFEHFFYVPALGFSNLAAPLLLGMYRFIHLLGECSFFPEHSKLRNTSSSEFEHFICGI